MPYRKIWNSPLIMGLATLLTLLAISQYLALQKYWLARDKQHEKLQNELVNIKDKFVNILHSDIAAANALAILYNQDHVPVNFDSVASRICKYSPYVDALQLQQRGIITHMYPLAGNENFIGFNTFSDSLRLQEAHYAAERQSAYFAGPRPLRNGGVGILGKVPIIVNGEVVAFSVVRTRMSVVEEALRLKDKKIFAYSLLKKDKDSKDTSAYAMNNARPREDLAPVSVAIPEGNWILQVAYSTNYTGHSFPIELSVLGILLSAITSLAVYRKLRHPLLLKKIIESKTLELSASEKYYRTLIETSSDAIVLIDRYGNTIYQTPSTEKISGYSLAEMQEVKGVNLIHPDDLKKDGEEFGKLMRTPGSIMVHKHRVRRKDGEYIWIEGTYRNLLQDENVGAIVYSYTDVTERYRSLEQISKYNLELTLLNSVNDIILHAEEKTVLFDEICQCIVNVGKYKLAWIGEVPEDISQTEGVAPTAACGDMAYLNAKLATGCDKFSANSPVIAAVIRNEPTIINNTGTSPDFAAWCGEAKPFDISSAIVLPLSFNNSRGALSIYSSVHSGFGAHELSIFKRLAENISLAVRGIQDRNDKEESAKQLNERVKELSTIYQLNTILQDQEQSADEIFTKIVNILPQGWQYPEKCAACIEFNGKIYQTEYYRPSKHAQTSPIALHDGRKGLIEVVYLDPSDSARPFLKEEHDLMQTVSTTIEVYFNKRAHQAALTKSEANLRSVFENTEIGYLLLDANLDIVAFNQYMNINYRKQSGIGLVVGDNFLQPMEGERKARIAKIYGGVIASNTPLEYETQYTNDGVTNYFQVNVVPVRHNKQVTGLSLAIYEITQLKNLEQEREKIIRDLTQRNTDLEQFAQIVSHNLRGPLSTILGVNMLLEDPMPEEEKDTLLGDIRAASNRLDTVIMDLNEILHVRTDESESKVALDLSILIKEVQSSLATMIRDSGARIACDFAEAKELMSVRSYMDSIFHNLITNSIKFAIPGEKPSMKIWTEQREAYVIIYYKDNSQGIDLDKHREKVFQLYQRFHLDIEGKGLGLFMTKTQVEVLGGTITVDSTPGNGCLFAITFPS